MTSRDRQRGYINLPRGFFEIVGTLAAIGALAVIVAVVYGLYWIITHVRFV